MELIINSKGNYSQYETTAEEWKITQTGFENMQVLKKFCADTFDVYKNKKR